MGGAQLKHRDNFTFTSYLNPAIAENGLK